MNIYIWCVEHVYCCDYALHSRFYSQSCLLTKQRKMEGFLIKWGLISLVQ